MKRRSLILSLPMVFFLPLFCLAEEELSVTTYFPSPYLVVRELRLLPVFPAPACDAIDTGSLIYNSSADAIEVCKGPSAGNWSKLASGGFAAGLWNISGTSVYPGNASWNVGLGGITAPNCRLQVNGAISRQFTSVNDASQVNLGVGNSTALSVTAAFAATVSGGFANTANGFAATVSGGSRNTASGSYGTVSGGAANIVNTTNGVVTGGSLNRGGYVAGGYNNTVSHEQAYIAGGSNNQATVWQSSVLGGEGNLATAKPSIVIGGYHNTASVTYCMAAGKNANANRNGAFVWSGDYEGPYTANDANSFNIRASSVWFSGEQHWDISEHIEVLEGEQCREGELVRLDGEGRLARTREAFDPDLIGVISGGNTSVLHLASFPLDDSRPIALAGKAFVWVNNEGGSIRPGDPIAASSVPGEGMKASRPGRIVGLSLQGEDFSRGESKEVLVFVCPGQHVPKEKLEELRARVKALKKGAR